MTVRAVLDADMLQLTDGRKVRLLAADAPVLADCAGDCAAALTRDKVDGKTVKLLAEPGSDVDERGNLWRYVAYSERNDRRTSLPIFSQDLGNDLVLPGWANPAAAARTPATCPA